MRVFLIGFMGSGKTKLGRDLAGRLNLQYIDQDKEIEQAKSYSIEEIFKAKGEHRFREWEREILLHLLERDQYVLATGGGTPCYMDQIDLMNAAGRTVYLNVPQYTLLERLRKERDSRPLIAHLDDEGLEDFIAGKLSEREVYYKKAQIQVNPVKISLETLVRLIQE